MNPAILMTLMKAMGSMGGQGGMGGAATMGGMGADEASQNPANQFLGSFGQGPMGSAHGQYANPMESLHGQYANPMGQNQHQINLGGGAANFLGPLSGAHPSHGVHNAQMMQHLADLLNQSNQGQHPNQAQQYGLEQTFHPQGNDLNNILGHGGMMNPYFRY